MNQTVEPSHHPWPAAFMRRLRRILPADGLLQKPTEVAVYECDGLPVYRVRPRAVALPRTAAEVGQVLALCAEYQVPVVARGAGTGLSGGALPHPEGIVLSLARLNRILALDPDNRIARLEPGVRNLAVSEAARPHGLFYAPDPSSQIACTIGGNVAENAGGVHCLKYGLTTHNVLALKFFDAEGTLHEVGGPTGEWPLDLAALLTGSEGLLGVVVEVTVRLWLKPPSTVAYLAAFRSLEAAAACVSEVVALGIIPAGLELMDGLALSAAQDYTGIPYPEGSAAVVLAEVDGDDLTVALEGERLRAIFTAQGAFAVEQAVSDEDRRRLWLGRKSAFPAVGRLAPDYYCMDGTIPRRSLVPVLTEIGALSRRYELPVANVFHAGDGNLHPLILYDAAIPGQLAQVEALGADILRLCLAHGGTISGEHGVGVEKLDGMCVQFTAAELATFHALKSAFDPHHLLNPGKAVPTPARCVETGGMHVHGGHQPFPHLERF
ncbi:MAG: FAD-linked oxidase C-terminal domain-containing protein [Acidiferrobacter sp.]